MDTPIILKPEPANIPDELRKMPRWVNWRTERDEDGRIILNDAGKYTKVPVNPRSGRNASSTDPATWASFDEAVAAYESRGYDGIGFVLADGDGLVGIDIDHCIDADGNLSPLASTTLANLATYAEVSPSGTGIKMLTFGQLPAAARKKNSVADVEAYSSGRFFTITGHRIGDVASIVNANGALDDFVAKFLTPEPRPAAATVTPTQIVFSDADVIERCRKVYNGRFERLYDGNTADYPSHSEADQGLCAMLAYITQDFVQVDRLFRGSRLMRPKWDERHAGDGKTYGAMTVDKAISSLTDTYDETPTTPAVKQRVDPDTGEIITVKRLHRTDLGNAERLVREYGTDLRYVGVWKKWFVWNGRHWEEDVTSAVHRMAQATVRTIYAETAGVEDENVRKEIARWAMASESRNRLDAMIALAATNEIIVCKHDEFDADHWLLNVANGTIDLRTGKLRLHRRADLITKCLDIAYDPQAEAPLWDAFLRRVMDGNDEMIAFLQRAVGYSLTGSVAEQCLFFLYGNGRNGKSTFTGTIHNLLEPYAMKAPNDLVQLKPNGSEGIPNDIAELPGKRFVYSNELDEGRRMAEARVKDMAGGDVLKARFMRADWFQFWPTHKLWIYGNHRPTIVGQDDGIWRRIRLVPFTVWITDDEKDDELQEKLKAELPGILRWAVDGCLAWQRDGLGMPQAVEDATTTYRNDMDVVAAFIDDRCIIGPQYEQKFAELYEEYKDWCNTNGEKSVSGRVFRERLDGRNIRGFKGPRNVAMRRGIGLLKSPDAENTPPPNTKEVTIRV